MHAATLTCCAHITATYCGTDCVLNGHVQVELAGGNQRHPITQQFHTGLNYVQASGTPVYNFEVSALADASHDQASTFANDPQDEQNACTDVPHSSAVATTSAMANLPQPVLLRYITIDPLVQAGGLHARSERGRLAIELSEDQEAGDMILNFAEIHLPDLVKHLDMH